MESKQNPFSIYDFLGYFTPGAIFLYGCIGIFAHLQPNISTVDFLTQNLSLDKVEVYIPFILCSYAVGHILSYLSSIIIERYSIWTIGYPSKYMMGYPNKSYFDVGKTHKTLRIIIRTLVAILILPISILDWILGDCAKYRDLYAKPLDTLLINIIRAKMVTLLKEHSGLKTPPDGYVISDTDYFRFIYHYVVENAEHHLPKMQNYVAMYGFLRTLTFISIIFFWGGVFHILKNEFTLLISFWYLLTASLLSFVLYMAFIKFYRRFSLEAFMALTAIYTVKDKLDPEIWNKKKVEEENIVLKKEEIVLHEEDTTGGS